MENNKDLTQKDLTNATKDDILFKVEVSMGRAGGVHVTIPEEYQSNAALADVVFMFRCAENLMLNHYFNSVESTLGDEGNAV